MSIFKILNYNLLYSAVNLEPRRHNFTKKMQSNQNKNATKLRFKQENCINFLNLTLQAKHCITHYDSLAHKAKRQKKNSSQLQSCISREAINEGRSI